MNISNGIESLSQILPSSTVDPAVTSKVQPRDSQIIGSGTSASQTNAADKADLSAVGTQTAQAAQSIGSDSSDVRMDKVASIQDALQAGTYNVPASAVAQKLIGSMLEPQN